MSSSSLLSDLAPTGTLRVGINYGNPILAQKDAGSGELRGIAVDLGRELGKRVGAPVELVGFESAGKMFDAVKAGSWDVAFLAVRDGRETSASPHPISRSKAHTLCRPGHRSAKSPTLTAKECGSAYRRRALTICS